MGNEKPEVSSEQQESLGLDGTMKRILSFSPQSGACGAATQTAEFGHEITP